MTRASTLLLLGARGFAGSHLRDAAEAAGIPVIGSGRRAGESDLACDLLDPASVRDAIRTASPAVVANMAGSASVAASWKAPADTFAANATGVLNLLEALSAEAPEAHLLCASSAEVYGEADAADLPFTEDQALAPITPYGASKAAMEVLCRSYQAARGLRITIVRAFNQLGPRQSSEFAASGFARQISAAEVAGRDEVSLSVGNLAAARDFTDIRDTARAYVAICASGLTGTFNLCSGEARQLRSLVEEMRRVTPLRVEVREAPELVRPTDAPIVVGSPARLHEATGWRPEIPLERTVEDLMDWWRGELSEAEPAQAPA